MAKSKKSIIEIVKTVEDAFAIKPPSEDCKIVLSYNGDDPKMLAAKARIELEHVYEVIQEDWIPNYEDASQIKYEAVMQYKPGVGWVYIVYDYWDSTSFVGPRLTQPSVEKLKYIASQFAHLYNQAFATCR